MMRRPNQDVEKNDKNTPDEFLKLTQPELHHPNCSQQTVPTETSVETVKMKRERRKSQPNLAFRAPQNNPTSVLSDMLTGEALKAIDAIDYITEHLRRDNKHKKIREEWKYASMVIDRLLLYVFFAVTTGGTMGILFSAPNIFEYVNQTQVIEHLKKTAAAEMNLSVN
uniref:Neurotransmitter-gated ion-channel transmembrane domain-containing protein n=1 Tax=Ditylenchus dipsaci TaxID=166011 RepID=A0A915E9W1_9BILA